VLARHRERLVAVPGLSHDLHIRLKLQKRHQRLADHRLILGNHDPHCHTSIVACTRISGGPAQRDGNPEQETVPAGNAGREFAAEAADALGEPG
jgi:hypothetical protein